MDWGYVAGYFDGEGHVAKREYTIEWANTNRASLEAIQTFIGAGNIYASPRPAPRKPVCHLAIRNLTDLRRVVPSLIDHCIVKQPELERLLERTAHVRAQPNRGLLQRLGAPEIKRLYWQEELSCAEIGARFGVHGASVEAFLRSHGGVRTREQAMTVAERHGRRRGRYSDGDFPMKGVDPTEIQALYWKDGLSVKAIGSQYGLTREGMRAYMLRHGIPFRRRGQKP